MGDRLVTIDIGRKEGGGCCAPSESGAGSPSNAMWPGLRSTSIPSSILIHPAVWPQQTWAKNWGWRAVPLWGDLGPHLTICRLGQGLHRYQVASWSIQPFCHNRHGPKIGEGRLESPSNTMWPGLRSTSVPSGVVIHPAIWPQQTWA